MIRLSPCVKLPLKYIKGTESQRFAMAEKLTDEFFAAAKNEFAQNAGNCAVPKKLEKLFLKLLPEKIKMKLVPLEEGCLFAHTSFKLKPGMVKRHNINMKFTRDGKKIPLNEVYNLMHELRHTADYITNPKILARSIAAFEKGYQNGLNKFLMDNILYTQKAISRNKFVQKIALKIASFFQTTDEQINFLQKARYTLKTERNAFSKMSEFQTRAEKACNINKQHKSDLENLIAFDFDNKIKTVEEQLKNVLAKARRQHAASLKQN